MSGSKRRTDVSADARALAARVAEWITDLALAANGPFRIALSGGSTPQGLYALLASDAFRPRFPWQRVHWYWGDERFVPRYHPASNFRMAHDAMLARAPVPADNIHPVIVEGTPEQAAARYEQTLRKAYGASALDAARPLFDIMLLGLGADGHTASLLPGEPVLQERERWVAAVARGRPEVRITMTYPAIESSRNTAFLVSGAKKSAIVAEILGGGSTVPAARVDPVGELVWFLDRAAASESASLELPR